MVTSGPFQLVELETIFKVLELGMKEFEIRERIETLQITVLSKSVRVFWSV